MRAVSTTLQYKFGTFFPLLQRGASGQTAGHAKQGRTCCPWQMHDELPLEHITATISVTPSLISEPIGLLSNGRGPVLLYAQQYGKEMWWMYKEYGLKTFHSIEEFTMERSTHCLCFTAQRLNIILFSKEWHPCLSGEFKLKSSVCCSWPTVILLDVCFVYVSIQPMYENKIAFLKPSSYRF